MKVQMTDAGVPIVVTYRKVIRKPKLLRQRVFVGPVQMVKNLLVRAIEFVEGAAFETTTKVIDPGRSVSVHWAVSVEDPWDGTPGAEKNLIAYRMMNDVPPSGVHFEVISGSTEPDQQPDQAAEDDCDQEAGDVKHNPSTPSDYAYVNRRQPAPQYASRRVKTLDEEVIEGHEDVEDVDWSGGFGEDD